MNSATENQLKTGASLALGIANIFLPGSGTAIQLAPVVLKGVFDLYDTVIKAKPDDVTVEEWRARLTDPALTETADDYLNEARKALNVATPTA